MPAALRYLFRMGRDWLLDSAAVFLIALVLIAPLFALNWFDNWGSIESTFISDARMLKDWGYTPRWQPLWYCGTRWDYIYPPALRYGTALLSNLFKGKTTRGYHAYIGFFYCLGITGVYWLVRTGGRSRLWGYYAAIAVATISPSYVLISRLRDDVFLSHTLPLRLNVLIRYGEGPHMTALALIPVVLVLAWHGLRPGKDRWLAGAAAVSALVLWNNFYGATALAILFPVLCFSLWAAYRENRIWLRAVALGGLSLGLSTFWLTPSYVRVTLENMRWVASPGNRWSAVVAAASALVFAGAAFVWGRNRPWPVFVLGSAGLFGLITLGHEYFNFRVIGDPGRLVPEFDLCLILAAVLVASWMPRRAGILAMTILIIAGGYRYVPNAWRLFPKTKDYTQRVEYRIQRWMFENMPDTRASVSGSVRFWYDAWHDLPQVGGGSDQGVLNPNTMIAQYAFREDRPDRAIAWAKAMGAGALISHETKSEEHYHDWTEPRRFDGILPIAYDDARGNVIYRVERLYPERARVVDAASVRAIPPIFENAKSDAITLYAAAIETGPRVRMHRPSNEEIVIQARVAAGQALLVQESYDPAWRAYADGQRVAIGSDPARMMLVDVPPGDREIRLVFGRPMENLAGGAISILAAFLLGWLFWRGP